LEYSDDYLRQFLPSEDPMPDFVPNEVNEEVATWIERDELDDRALVARSTRWTYAMFNEWRLKQVKIDWEGPPHWWGDLWGYVMPGSFDGPAIGLFDRHTEKPGFGLIMETQVIDALRPTVVASIGFPRLKVAFPLLLRPVSNVDHALAHPYGATSAAWAKCNTSATWGILTAGHAVGGTSPGRTVPLASGPAGALVRSYHPPIDAAFVRTANRPVVTAPMMIRRFPATGHRVVVEIQSGGVNRTVVHVDSAMGVVNTRTYPVQLFIDQPCSPGDSGALIRTTSGEGCGVYLGSLSTPVQTGLAGRALNFEQATFALDITPYS